MPVSTKCPKCNETHEVPNVLTQEDHVARLKAKSDENAALKGELATAQTKVAGFDALASENTKVKGELAATREATARAAAFAQHGVAADDGIRKRFELVYNSAVAETPQGQTPPPFADWLGAETTKKDAFLAPHFGKPGAPQNAQAPSGQQQQNGQQGVRPAGPVGNTETGASNAADQPGIKSPEELRAHFASPAFKALPAAEQKKQEGELRAQLSKNGAAQVPAASQPSNTANGTRTA